MTIVWILDIDPRHGLRHGATLRYLNLSRGLLGSGHQVYFIVTNYAGCNTERRNQYLESLQNEGYFTGYVEFEGPIYPQPRTKLSRLLIHPRVRDATLRSVRREYQNRVEQVLRAKRADVCILSDRRLLFLLPNLEGLLPSIIDWGDSFTAYALRDIRLLLNGRDLRRLLPALRALVDAVIEETCYGRYSSMNIVVSRGDKRWFDRLNRRPARNHVLLNGINQSAFADAGLTSSDVPLPKNPNTLIFSGTMSFPPNYQAALWFIDRVMPLLIRRNPAIRLAIVGQEPVPALLAKAGNHVEITGLVPDLLTRIARSQLFVAPLVSGTGFRNKVIEALASGTYVIGTPMALEFLDERLRDKLLTAPTAEIFADQILAFLSGPDKFDQRLRESIEIVREEYLWPVRVRQFEDLCRSLKADRTASRVTASK
jgi:glycosyltransferase involved in cell wall biosynthesis